MGAAEAVAGLNTAGGLTLAGIKPGSTGLPEVTAKG